MYLLLEFGLCVYKINNIRVYIARRVAFYKTTLRMFMLLKIKASLNELSATYAVTTDGQMLARRRGQIGF